MFIYTIANALRIGKSKIRNIRRYGGNREGKFQFSIILVGVYVCGSVCMCARYKIQGTHQIEFKRFHIVCSSSWQFEWHSRFAAPSVCNRWMYLCDPQSIFAWCYLFVSQLQLEYFSWCYCCCCFLLSIFDLQCDRGCRECERNRNKQKKRTTKKKRKKLSKKSTHLDA